MSRSGDADLLQRCQQGDPEAWNQLFDQHYSAAGRFVFQLSPNFSKEDIEEICQETFLAVIRNIHTFQGQCQFQTWLFRIASNKAKDYRDRQSAAKRGGGTTTIPLHSCQSEPETGLSIDPPSPSPTPDADLMSKEQLELVRQALDLLGDPCREVIELRYFADLSYDEIAAMLQINPKTVSSRLSKCLSRFEAIAQTLKCREKNISRTV